MKKTHIFLIILLVFTTLESVMLLYAKEDLELYHFLARDPSLSELKTKFGMPEELIQKEQEPPMQGWPLPKNKRGLEIWIYTVKTGRRFYVHVNSDKDRIEYVFSSNS